ncbi:MAG: cation:proton antiporter subunit C [Treponema sp.]|nr:cation:proton antiporter subunit C [Treponema sp.]
MRFELVEVFAVLMFFVSFYGLIVSRNVIKSIVFIVVMETAVIMFFLTLGYRAGILAPIGPHLDSVYGFEMLADPFPQALMITAIVIGLCVTAVMVIMAITLMRKFNSTDWDTIKRKGME